jgi:hypothetical protein
MTKEEYFRGRILMTTKGQPADQAAACRLRICIALLLAHSRKTLAERHLQTPAAICNQH